MRPNVIGCQTGSVEVSGDCDETDTGDTTDKVDVARGEEVRRARRTPRLGGAERVRERGGERKSAYFVALYPELRDR